MTSTCSMSWEANFVELRKVAARVRAVEMVVEHGLSSRGLPRQRAIQKDLLDALWCRWLPGWNGFVFDPGPRTCKSAKCWNTEMPACHLSNLPQDASLRMMAANHCTISSNVMTNRLSQDVKIYKKCKEKKCRNTETWIHNPLDQDPPWPVNHPY